jgi:alpha-tubulin suppressor-like RCC1 family protein
VFCWPNATDYAVREVRDHASQKSLEGVGTIHMQSAIDEVDYAYFTACALHDSRAISCWGRHEAELPGIAARTPFWSHDVQVPPQVTQIAVGARHLCMLTAFGEVHCLGDVPSSGALGLPLPPKGTTYDKPTLVPGLDHVIELVAGSWHTCVRRATGQVQCFGRNGVGELGNGGTLMSYQPVNVVGLP